MPFHITKEMRVMREAEESFGTEVVKAQLREMSEWGRWRERQRLRRMRRALGVGRSQVGQPEPEVLFRPSSPNHLYVLAREAWDGDYRSYERFLNYLGLKATDDEATSDAIDALAEQLRVTFVPRGNKRRKWWYEPSHEAREWLRQRITGKANPGRSVELNTELIDPKDKHKDGRKILEPDLREFMIKDAVFATLPERQAEVVMLYAMLYDETRPRETTKAVAEQLQISPATTRWHKAEALKNHRFRMLWGLS